MNPRIQAAVDCCYLTPGHRGLVYSADFSRSHRLWHDPPKHVTTNAIQHSWLFPNGSRLTFGYPEAERYTGCELSFIDFDPDTEYFSEQDVEALLKRLRLGP